MAKLTKGRVSIPNNTIELIALAKKVNAKHISDGPASVLNSMQDQNWNLISPKILQCESLHNQAEALKLQMEMIYRERDALLPEIKSIVQDSRSFLKGVFSKNPKKLGEWGYEIDDTVQVAKKTSAAKSV
ncbi:MAG: hypothetical protein EAZ53_02250 [Bacteroidetes bacterium]|nr:MAG: hypothetical protein EAZ53_02250 [Bacteroidota bacterium]